MTDSNCLFCKISAGEIPAEVVFQDDDVVAFRDVQPKAPVHLLVIPRKHIVSIAEIDVPDQDLMGKLLLTAKQVADEEGLSADGYRVAINIGKNGGQTVFHLHVHVMGGRSFTWPPG